VPTDDEADSAEVADATFPSLRKNRNFRFLWIGQVLSDLGSAFGALAYPLLLLLVTHSPFIAGLVGTVSSLAAFLVRLPAGSLADRLDRRRTMIVTDGVRTIVLAVFAVGVATHFVTWPVIMIVAVIDRVGDTIFSPSSTAALPLIVHDTQLESAWAATEARQYAANLGGPALGGILFNIGRAVPFVGDAVSYGVSTVTSWSLKGSFDAKPSEGPRRGLWAEAFDGFRTIWNDALLRAVIIQAPLINFAFTGAIFTVTVALQQHKTSSSVIGLVQSFIMVGGFLGALVAPKIQGRLKLSQLVVLLTLSGSLLFGVSALILPSAFVAVPLAIPLFISPTTNAALFASMLRETPEEMRGRVNNALLQVATGMAAFAPLFVGVVVEHFSGQWAMGTFAIVLAISTVLALALPGLRQAEAASAEGSTTT
jgi:MFS family permease